MGTGQGSRKEVAAEVAPKMGKQSGREKKPGDLSRQQSSVLRDHVALRVQGALEKGWRLTLLDRQG